MAVITLCNEFGTDGEAVATALTEALGYEVVGDQLLAEIAKELQMSESEANTFRQTASSRLLRFFDRYTCSIVQKVVDGERGCLDDKAYYEKTRELVEKLYDNDNVVILNWGAQCILRGKPGTLHVRLRKDHALKVSLLMKKEGVDRKNAEHQIKVAETDAQSYIRHYFDQDWNDVHLYDLVIDMGQTPVPDAARRICENLTQKTGR